MTFSQTDFYTLDHFEI